MSRAAETLPYRRPDVADEEVVARARAAYERLRTRRSVREFSDRPVPREAIEAAILAAGTAPNGANQQPWTFVAVADPDLKHEIRRAAEAEERAFYRSRAPEAWLEALAPLGTNESKPFLDTAPWLVAVFAKPYGVGEDGERVKHYYVQESVGIAVGMLVASLHEAGLSCLTHTPSPMGFLSRLLDRPAEERAYLLLVVGHAAENARVPRIEKRRLEEIAVFHDADPVR